MKRERIKNILNSETPGSGIVVCGWLKTKRDAKGFSFLEINDGSCLANLQVIATSDLSNYSEIRKLKTGSSLKVTGSLRPSPGKGQRWELEAESVHVFQAAPDDYPLQKKRHSDEFLRSIAHLRARTNKYGAAFRIRSLLAIETHKYFSRQGFTYIHTPILTASDCEGAGEMFVASKLQPQQIAELVAARKDPFSEDLFKRKANLTVSGQLAAEMLALALGDVYTFGPAFRAENSNTRRHASEFWMVEPEMAFCDLENAMDAAEDLVKHLVSTALDECIRDISLFSKYVDRDLEKRLETMRSGSYARIPYAEAIKILESKAESFEYKPVFGCDLQSEHEQFLVSYFNGRPVFVYDFPKSIKPFYMRVNNDEQTVAAMDLLVPGIGEIVGGSQREERYDVLLARMKECGIDPKDYDWYLDSRRYGSVPHSGYGLGFDRLVMLVTGIKNIRDVIPFPRTPGALSY